MYSIFKDNPIAQE